MKTHLTIMKVLFAAALSVISFCSNAGQTSYYIYDESGHVIGEYDQNGNPVQEHIYLGDRPVAVVTGGSSSSGTVDYVTTDQLNTPRDITDGSGAVIWSWNSDPFGNGQPIAPSFTYNLRFPGQYYDAETGKNYNYRRDYDPSTGRYIESDPIGLAAGTNTYLYVGGRPLDYIDPTGTICRLMRWDSDPPSWFPWGPTGNCSCVWKCADYDCHGKTTNEKEIVTHGQLDHKDLFDYEYRDKAGKLHTGRLGPKTWLNHCNCFTPSG
jgi:RHS repeat-associated protein